MYDDFKTPSNTITHSVKDFVNSWLATRTGSCFLTKENNEAPRCNKAPSERCFELFNKKSSPFSGFFKTVDPLPFLKACLADTADCSTKQDSAMAHCNATAAYRRLLKSKREYAHQEIEDCCKFHAIHIYCCMTSHHSIIFVLYWPLRYSDKTYC